MKFFSRWPRSEGARSGPPAQVGGFSLQKRTSKSYPSYTPTDSNRGWHGNWFYIRNPVNDLFPTFTGVRPSREESWSWGPVKDRRNRMGVLESTL